MTEQFAEVAAGATELRIKVDRGDVSVRTSEGAEWTLEWTGDDQRGPEVERQAQAIRVRQRSDHPHEHGHNPRLDLRVRMPKGVEAVDLSSGSGAIEADGGTVRSQLTTGNGPVTLRSAGGEVHVTTGNGQVEISGSSADVAVTTGNGHVKIERADGRVGVTTGNGNIELAACSSLRANTGNGDLALHDATGEAEFNTGHGQVRISGPRDLSVRANAGAGNLRIDGGSLRGLHFHTGHGNAECSARLLPGDYELETEVGDLEMALPSDVQGRVNLQTGAGSVQSDFPLVQVGRSGPMGFGGVRMVGSIGDGSAELDIRMRTGKGRLVLRRAPGPGRPGVTGSTYVSTESAAGEAKMVVMHQASSSEGGISAATASSSVSVSAPDPSPAPAQPAPAKDPILAILEAVARGAISPDEAEVLLTKAQEALR